MTRIRSQTMRLRRPAWIIRVIRRLRNPDGNWPILDTRPWWHHWTVMIPYRFRALHQAYAAARSYFWLPCPLCDRPFGGHEWRHVNGLPSSVPDPTGEQSGYLAYVGICPECTRAGKGTQ
jgi:hypothetical protein